MSIENVILLHFIYITGVFIDNVTMSLYRSNVSSTPKNIFTNIRKPTIGESQRRETSIH